MESIQQSERQRYRGILPGQNQSERLPARLLLILEAYLGLIRFDLYIRQHDFDALYKKIRNYPTTEKHSSPDSVEPICAAVDVACIWYRKEVLCLQRSAATACLLRKYGIAAEVVIGAQQMPFKAHAWVEIDGKVVNDKQHVRELYACLDRC